MDGGRILHDEQGPIENFTPLGIITFGKKSFVNKLED